MFQTTNQLSFQRPRLDSPRKCSTKADSVYEPQGTMCSKRFDCPSGAPRAPRTLGTDDWSISKASRDSRICMSWPLIQKQH